jgi:hypothetical protein
MATPEPAVTSGMRPATAAQHTQVVVVHGIGHGQRHALGGAAPQPFAHGVGPCATSSVRSRPTRAALCACSTRTRLASVIGVSGWSRMPLSDSSWSPTNRWPLNTVRPFSGKAGQAMANRRAQRVHQRLGHRADVAGGVESKVEQYLK